MVKYAARLQAKATNMKSCNLLEPFSSVPFSSPVPAQVTSNLQSFFFNTKQFLFATDQMRYSSVPTTTGIAVKALRVSVPVKIKIKTDAFHTPQHKHSWLKPYFKIVNSILDSVNQN
jgi:hypothetical protein